MACLNLIRPLLRKPMYSCSPRALPFLINNQVQELIFKITLKRHPQFQFQFQRYIYMRKSAFEGKC